MNQATSGQSYGILYRHGIRQMSRQVRYSAWYYVVLVFMIY